MKCLEVGEQLSAYMDGELTDAEMQIVTEHLHTCEVCQEQLALFARTREVFRDSLAHVEAPQNLEFRVMEGLTQLDFEHQTERLTRGSISSLVMLVLVSMSLLFSPIGKFVGAMFTVVFHLCQHLYHIGAILLFSSQLVTAYFVIILGIGLALVCVFLMRHLLRKAVY